MQITVGEETHQPDSGDCIAFPLDRPVAFHNPTADTTRYAVVTATPPAPTPEMTCRHRRRASTAIRRLMAPGPAELAALTDVLIDCVEGGPRSASCCRQPRAGAGVLATVADGVVRQERAAGRRG